MSIYRSPNSQSENNEEILRLPQQITECNTRHKVIVGDFNLPNIKWENLTCKHGNDNLSRNFCEKVRDCFFIQHMSEVTRSRGESIGNTLDPIFSDDDLLVENIIVGKSLGKSDPGCLQFKCSMETQKVECRKQVYVYENADYSKLCRLLSLKWDEYLDDQDVEVTWEKFKLKFQEAIDVCVQKNKNQKNKKKFVRQERLRKRRNQDLKMNKKLWSKTKKKQTLVEIEENEGGWRTQHKRVQRDRGGVQAT